MSARDYWWGGVALVCCGLLGLITSVSQAKYRSGDVQRVVTQISTPQDFAELRADVAATDTTNISYSSSIAFQLDRAEVFYAYAEFTGSSDSCTIRAAFFDVDGNFLFSGDDYSATASPEAEDSLYQPTEGVWEWQTRGAYYAIPWVTDLSGTVTISGGTR